MTLVDLCTNINLRFALKPLSFRVYCEQDRCQYGGFICSFVERHLYIYLEAMRLVFNDAQPWIYRKGSDLRDRLPSSWLTRTWARLLSDWNKAMQDMYRRRCESILVIARAYVLRVSPHDAAGAQRPA